MRLHPGTWAGALKISFWAPVAKVVLSYYTPICNLSISGSWGFLGVFGPQDGSQIWFWAPVAKVVLFYYTAISKLSISGSWGSLGCFGPPDCLKSGFWRLAPKCYLSITLLLAN